MIVIVLGFMSMFTIAGATASEADCVGDTDCELPAEDIDTLSTLHLIQRRAINQSLQLLSAKENGSAAELENLSAQQLQEVVGARQTLVHPYVDAKQLASSATNYLLELDSSLMSYLVPSPAVPVKKVSLEAAERIWPVSATFVIVLALLITVLGLLGMNWTGKDGKTASIKPASEAVEDPQMYFKSQLGDLINMLGIPAFCVLDFGREGLSGLPLRVTMALLAAQSWILQGAALIMLLYGIKTSAVAEPLPRIAIALATYLNVLGHLSEFPRGGVGGTLKSAASCGGR